MEAAHPVVLVLQGLNAHAHMPAIPQSAAKGRASRWEGGGWVGPYGVSGWVDGNGDALHAGDERDGRLGVHVEARPGASNDGH